MTPTTQRTEAQPDATLVMPYANEAGRAIRLARAAIDDLDAATAIAHLRSLKSTVWRAERAGVTLLELKPAVDQDRSPRDWPHIETASHEGS